MASKRKTDVQLVTEVMKELGKDAAWSSIQEAFAAKRTLDDIMSKQNEADAAPAKVPSSESGAITDEQAEKVMNQALAAARSDAVLMSQMARLDRIRAAKGLPPYFTTPANLVHHGAMKLGLGRRDAYLLSRGVGAAPSTAVPMRMTAAPDVDITAPAAVALRKQLSIILSKRGRRVSDAELDAALTKALLKQRAEKEAREARKLERKASR